MLYELRQWSRHHDGPLAELVLDAEMVVQAAWGLIEASLLEVELDILRHIAAGGTYHPNSIVGQLLNMAVDDAILFEDSLAAGAARVTVWLADGQSWLSIDKIVEEA